MVTLSRATDVDGEGGDGRETHFDEGAILIPSWLLSDVTPRESFRRMFQQIQADLSIHAHIEGASVPVPVFCSPRGRSDGTAA